jgi:hypothetical protein
LLAVSVIVTAHTEEFVIKEKQILKGSDDGLRPSGVMGFWTLPIFRYSVEHQRTHRFGNWTETDAVFETSCSLDQRTMDNVQASITPDCQGEFNIQDYWVLRLYPSSGILKNTKFRRPDLFPSSGEVVGPLESANLSHNIKLICYELRCEVLPSGRDTVLFGRQVIMFGT